MVADLIPERTFGGSSCDLFSQLDWSFMGLDRRKLPNSSLWEAWPPFLLIALLWISI